MTGLEAARPPVTDRIGQALVAVTVLAVAVSWLPGLLGPLGDNHEGRIYGMIALQVSNVWELGLAGSQWGTSREPFAAAYSHHPPAFNLWYWPAWGLPGDPTVWIRVLPYTLGLAFLPASAGLLRRLGVSWIGIGIAVAVVATSPLYWVYGRIWPALGLVAILAWVIADVRNREQVSTRRLAAVCVLVGLAVATNWFVMATAALLGLWLLAGRGRDRVTVAVGVTMTIVAAATVAWVLAAPDTVGAGEQLLHRTTGGGFTTAEFGARVWRWLAELLQPWHLLAIPGLAVAIADRRTRTVAIGATVVGVAWVVAFPNGTWVHDYWVASLLVPTIIVLAVLADRLVRSPATATAGAALAAVTAIVLVTSPVPQDYIASPQDAGRLVQRTVAPPQPQGWVTRFVAGPTWMGYAWQMPVSIVRTNEDLAEVPDDHVVLVNTGRPPPWVGNIATLRGKAIDEHGAYVLVTGAVLREASADD